MGNLTVAERFWAKVDTSGNCWVWTASGVPAGYGVFYESGRGVDRVRVYAHRWSYTEKCGPIPDGLEIDHLCRNTRCVRPDHLEPVTHAENKRRTTGIKRGSYNVGTHCPNGHERNAENTAINYVGARYCRVCSREATARSRKKRKANT